MEGTIMRMLLYLKKQAFLVGHLFRLHGAASCGRLG